MNCEHCDGELVVFAVPDDLRAYAPDDAATASLCATCLRVDAPPDDGGADGGDSSSDAGFAAVSDAFPSGRGGVALALLLGHLDSLALNRAAVETLAEEAERAGADPFLTLDRLGDDDGVVPHFDFERRRRQAESVLF
ncbi:DUF6276 family protein [Halogeometricum limi]|uniref:Small CPxCG-related zinc finger protein n=1 Tax=Halogeometricum limi TaxID=555875 RepID=A0A1I6FXC9_9EURY|nr:DUF6276 family protein [Halogeometricum limi]SFR34550.1 hypothetical protein SAMN04488124_0477 [Halogeometricum limi]